MAIPWSKSPGNDAERQVSLTHHDESKTLILWLSGCRVIVQDPEYRDIQRAARLRRNSNIPMYLVGVPPIAESAMAVVSTRLNLRDHQENHESLLLPWCSEMRVVRLTMTHTANH